MNKQKSVAYSIYQSLSQLTFFLLIIKLVPKFLFSFLLIICLSKWPAIAGRCLHFCYIRCIFIFIDQSPQTRILSTLSHFKNHTTKQNNVAYWTHENAEIVKILRLSCFYFEMFPRPGIAVLLVAVATRMSLCLSLFSPLLLVLRWRRHREPIGKKTDMTFWKESTEGSTDFSFSRGRKPGVAARWSLSLGC